MTANQWTTELLKILQENPELGNANADEVFREYELANQYSIEIDPKLGIKREGYLIVREGGVQLVLTVTCLERFLRIEQSSGMQP